MKKLKIVAAVLVVIAIVVLAYFAGRRSGGGAEGGSSATTTSTTSGESELGGDEGAEGAGTASTLWTCPMHPAVQLPKKDKCPICGMDLIELAEDRGGDPRQLEMSEAGKALAEIATAPVERRYAAREVRMVGKVALDETRVKTITAWIAGRLERLFVDYTGVPVKKGDHMVSLYSPDLLTAQRELQQAVRRQDGDGRFNRIALEAARQKLRLWGLTDEQVKEIEASDQPSDHVTIYSPVGGIVVHKAGLVGMHVEVGTPIYTIADLNHVWVHLDAYESDIQWLRHGQTVEFESESYPGQIFAGRIAFIQPVLDERSRSVKVRVNVTNEDGRLKPGMFVRATVRAKLGEGGVVEEGYLVGKWVCPMHPEEVAEGPGDCSACEMPLVPAESLGYAGGEASGPPLVVPVTAPLMTGKRAVVYVEVEGTEKPTYEGRTVRLGARAGDVYLVREGLEEGERVVVEGNFKIDSALQIRAKPSMMSMDVLDDEAPRIDRGFEAPESFRRQLGVAIELYTEAGQRLAADDVSGARMSFVALGASIGAVDMTALDAAAHLAWMEDAAVLSRGVEEARRAGGDIERQRRGLLILSEALPRVVRHWRPLLSGELRRFHCPMAFDDRGADWYQREERIANPYFGVTMLRCGEEVEVVSAAGEKVITDAAANEAGVVAVAPPKTDEEKQFRSQLGAVFDAYLEVQEGLADDDAEAAAEAVVAANAALAEVDMKLLTGDDHHAWTAANAEIGPALAAMAEAGDELTSLRAAFGPWSKALSAAQKSFHPETLDPIGLFFCPMAFDGDGAHWFQTGKVVRNPYYGDAMLRCGSRVEGR